MRQIKLKGWFPESQKIDRKCWSRPTSRQISWSRISFNRESRKKKKKGSESRIKTTAKTSYKRLKTSSTERSLGWFSAFQLFGAGFIKSEFSFGFCCFIPDLHLAARSQLYARKMCGLKHFFSPTFLLFQLRETQSPPVFNEFRWENESVDSSSTRLRLRSSNWRHIWPKHN